MVAAILATMLSDLLYMEVDITEYAKEWSFVTLGTVNFYSFASFVPE